MIRWWCFGAHTCVVLTPDQLVEMNVWLAGGAVMTVLFALRAIATG